MFRTTRSLLKSLSSFEAGTKSLKPALMTIAMCGFAYAGTVYYQRPTTVAQTTVETIGKAKLGGKWSLIDSSTGKPITSDDLKGKYSLLYFGFTFCPDICPQELEKVQEVLAKLKSKGVKEVVPVFITVDPKRDSCAQVDRYVKEFGPTFKGLTGTPEAIKKVSRMYRVYFNDGIKATDEDYLIDHSSKLFGALT